MKTLIGTLALMIGLALMFGGVGYAEQGGNLLTGVLVSLAGIGLLWLLFGWSTLPYRYHAYAYIGSRLNRR